MQEDADDTVAEESEEVIDQMSMKAVLGSCSDFTNVKSRIERLMDKRGHRVLLSSKYHAECAGVVCVRHRLGQYTHPCMHTHHSYPDVICHDRRTGNRVRFRTM